jgi:hypothetical protein
MISFIFCVLFFAILDEAQQESLRSRMTYSNLDRANVRILQLDSDTSFPIIEALEIQFEEWTFWVTLVPFVIIVFMAWKEKCLSLPYPYFLLGGIIAFSYYMIPLVILYGVYCFRAQIKSMMNGGSSKPTINQSSDKGTEMTERLLPREPSERIVRSNPPRDPMVEKERSFGTWLINKVKNFASSKAKEEAQALKQRTADALKQKAGDALKIAQVHATNAVQDVLQLNIKQQVLADPIRSAHPRHDDIMMAATENNPFIKLERFSSIDFDQAVFQDDAVWKGFPTLNNYKKLEVYQKLQRTDWKIKLIKGTNQTESQNQLLMPTNQTENQNQLLMPTNQTENQGMPTDFEFRIGPYLGEPTWENFQLNPNNINLGLEKMEVEGVKKDDLILNMGGVNKVEELLKIFEEAETAYKNYDAES